MLAATLAKTCGPPGSAVEGGPTATQRTLRARLDAAGVAYELISQPDAGTGASVVAKTIVLSTHQGLVRAIVPSARRLDLDKVRELLGTRHVELARAEDLAGGRPYAGQLLIDGRICDTHSVVIETDADRQALRVRPADLVARTDALLGDLCHDTGAAAAFRH